MAELIHCWDEQILQPLRTSEVPNSLLENYQEMMWNMHWLNQLCDTVKMTHKHLPHDDEWWKCSLDLEITREKNSSTSGWEFSFSATGRKPSMFALSLKVPLYKCRRIFNSHTFLPVTKFPEGWNPELAGFCLSPLPLLTVLCERFYFFSFSLTDWPKRLFWGLCGESVQHPGLKQQGYMKSV